MKKKVDAEIDLCSPSIKLPYRPHRTIRIEVPLQNIAFLILAICPLSTQMCRVCDDRRNLLSRVAEFKLNPKQLGCLNYLTLSGLLPRASRVALEMPYRARQQLRALGEVCFEKKSC